MENTAGSSLTNTPIGNIQEKKVYNVGDTLSIVNYGFSINEYKDGYHINNGNQVLEVEVKSVKVAKTILE